MLPQVCMFLAMICLTSRSRCRALKLAAIGLSLMSLSACSIPINDRGNMPKANALAQIKPGVTNKQSVTRLLGSPSSIAVFNNNTWYYIGHKTKDIAFLKPEVLSQEVVAIHFNKKGVVTAIDRKNLKNAQAVTPNPNKTPAQGRKFTFLEQLIGNFGKFDNTRSTRTPGAPNPGAP